MSEAELLLLGSESLDRVWSLVQWWASISFGLLVIAHIAADRIGLFVAVLVSMLYTGFTLAVLRIAQRNMGIVESVIGDLRVLKTAGVELTMTAQYWMQGSDPVIKMAMPAVVVFTYLSVLGYFIYSYRNKFSDGNT